MTKEVEAASNSVQVEIDRILEPLSDQDYIAALQDIGEHCTLLREVKQEEMED